MSIEERARADRAATALGRIGAAETLRALTSVREGRTYDLGLELGSAIPQGSPEHMAGFRLSRYRSSTETGAAYGLEFSSEIVIGTPHVSTHIDALCHYAFDGRIFGGASVADVHTDFGFTEHAMETVPPIIGRGVLVDVPLLFGVPMIADGFEITADHLAATLELQRTELRDGDVVLVRTGKIAQFFTDQEVFMKAQGGVGPEGAIWLYEQGMSVLGTDTPATEPAPHPDPRDTTHKAMLVERGVHLIENLALDELARDRIYAFAFVCLPLRMTGSTGSWVRPVAIV
ncbi:Kynurenine formamidase [Baekduia alba]|uniref:cyclase family protein n=1 Tax=Baekduia alba TaxID=2997333 RepID=UPI0023414AD2|nr:cyclase family protein [Baekduia alba]WCB95345.1 Kynurenine formamidase [Baekduia alba]